jgi:hypothetical protein
MVAGAYHKPTSLHLYGVRVERAAGYSTRRTLFDTVAIQHACPFQKNVNNIYRFSQP